MTNKTIKKNIHSKTHTMKIYGGDIEKKTIFRKILSIGYELETSSFAKLNLIGDDYQKKSMSRTLSRSVSISQSKNRSKAISKKNNNLPILLNTDTVPKDYEVIKRIKNDDYTEEEFDYYANRLDEYIELDAYTTESIGKKKRVINPDTVFLSANDMAVTPFTKYLNVFCNMDDIKATDNEDDDGEEEDLFDKNDLYTFATDNGEKYRINFETWQKKDCGMFADVEWIMTYYKPKISNNIILNTFINVAENLLLHLSQLEKTRGNLVMNFSGSDKEIIKRPVDRYLYHLPDTNLYYLQTHLLEEQLDIDDVCVVPQMTFSCHIKDIVDIMKELPKDDVRLFETYPILSDGRVELLNKIEKTVTLLLKNYNKSVSKDYRIIAARNETLVQSIKNYIFMILFKLNRYFNNYLLDEKVKNKSKTAKYLKDTLFYNSRHTNYDLYKEIKQSISEYFSNKLDNKEIVDIVQKIIIQQAVLEEYILDDKSNVRKNAFLITNKLEKTNQHYGDPYYSLVSYFDFFENPIDNPERRNDKNELFFDWLQYTGIDNYSSTTDIKKNIVLVEVRLFARLMANYIYSIADDELKNNMTNGVCNRMKKYFQPDITGFSMTILKQFITLHKNMKNKKKN
jgi:hypothetical protein